MQALSTDDGQAAVGVPQNEHGIRPSLRHELVAQRDDVAHGLAQVLAHGVEIDVRLAQSQILEEDAVEGVVPVLAGVAEQTVEVPAAGLDDLGEPDDLRPRAHDDEQAQAAVLPETHLESARHLDLLVERVRPRGVEALARPHQGHKVLCGGSVRDAVGIAGGHLHDRGAVTRNVPFHYRI